jgi:cephalosporin hydroxylase
MNHFDPTKQITDNLLALSSNRDLGKLSKQWLYESIRCNYLYNFSWLGIPIIQLPQDMYAVQELIWKVKPDLIIETGVAHGGSLFLSSTLLRLLDLSDCVSSNQLYDPSCPKRKVIGIDIEFREHNLRAIETHPLSSNIHLIKGSSIDQEVVDEIFANVQGAKNVLIILDSRHTSEHVKQELKMYSPFVSVGSYIIVMDTFVESLPNDTWRSNVEYSVGNGPMIACDEFLEGNSEFIVDSTIENKLQLTSSPSGFLLRVK